MKHLFKKLYTGIGYGLGWIGLGVAVLLSIALGLLQCAFLPYTLPVMLLVGLFLPAILAILFMILAVVISLVSAMLRPLARKRAPAPDANET